jgi:hypothetical protein
VATCLADEVSPFATTAISVRRTAASAGEQGRTFSASRSVRASALRQLESTVSVTSGGAT